MKIIKYLVGIIAAIVVSVAMILNVNFSAKNDNLSDILLKNVEALAGGESGDVSESPYKEHPCNKPGGGSQCGSSNYDYPKCYPQNLC